MKSICTLILVLMAGTAFGQGNFSTGLNYASDQDYQAMPKTAKYRAFLPEKIDLSPLLPIPGDQGDQGSCVGWAVAYAARSYYVGASNGRKLVPKNAFSPAYVYNQIRSRDEGCHSGSKISDALNLLQFQGVATLSDFPYIETQCSKKPSEKTIGFAEPNKIDSWRAIERGGLENIKGELYRNNPVIVGMDVPNSFQDIRGPYIFSDTRSRSDGGHAMVIVGYDDKKSAFRIINSWGQGWGEGGYGWVDYAAMAERGREYYVMNVPLVKPDPVSPPVIEPLPPAPSPKPETPEPITPSRDTVLNQIQEIISIVECGKISPELNQKGKLTLSGFIGSAEQLEELTGKLQDVIGVISIQSKIQVAPWPQCEAFLTLDSIKKNQSKLSVTIPNNTNNIFKKDDLITFDIRLPQSPGYVYVSYLQASGDAVPLLWDRQFAAGQQLNLGKTGKRFRISEPFGNELLIVITSPKLLFDEAKIGQDDRQYLSQLRQKILSLSEAEKSKINASTISIRTIEK
jgi:hypothetical protein